MKFLDMTGQRFGNLSVLRRVSEVGDVRGVVWLCRCDCGNEKGIAAGNLRSGQHKSCGCGRFHELTGRIYGKLTVISRTSNLNGRTRWVCRCECGVEKVVSAANLVKSNGTRSCGCFRRPAGTGSINRGYVIMYRPDHPNAWPSNGLVAEHIVVMSDLLGRPLRPGENVHHKNGVRNDNRPTNLELWTTMQPAGKRVAELVDWARQILDLYADEFPEEV